MSIEFLKRTSTDKKYYILSSFAVTPVQDYIFNETEKFLQLFVDNQCFSKNPKSKHEKSKFEKISNEMGFEWEPLSEPGHMRQMPYAITIMEAIEKYVWSVVEKFSQEQNFPLYRVSGGELFDSNNPKVKKQLLLISKNSEPYGSNLYNVIIDKKKRVLRYNACMQKLSVVKGADLYSKDLPLGLFEVSKSYRFEEEDELQLCKRVRSFHILELDVINDALSSSVKMALAAHKTILDEIEKIDTEYELLCSVTKDFFKENFAFLKTIVKSVKKPILLAIYENITCKDGVKIDIEYKVFDGLKLPEDIATLLIDDGSTAFSLGLKFKTKNDIKKPVSILHVAFPSSSLERSAYFLIDRAIKQETALGFRQLPFWSTPIQIRIIAYDQNCLKDAIKLAEELNLLNFRVDLDDRKINYDIKKKTKDLKWIPYVVTVDKNNKNLQRLIVENKIKGTVKKIMRKEDLIEEIKTEDGANMIVPRYLPMFLSKRVISGPGRNS